eukprot:SAG31_NODE_4185_length_3494_cov_1.707511_3_plen_282_part_00
MKILSCCRKVRQLVVDVAVTTLQRAGITMLAQSSADFDLIMACALLVSKVDATKRSPEFYGNAMTALQQALPAVFDLLGFSVEEEFGDMPLVDVTLDTKLNSGQTAGNRKEHQSTHSVSNIHSDGAHSNPHQHKQLGLNLQAVEHCLCEYRKFVTEQAGPAVFCGKLRTRNGVNYKPPANVDTNTSSAEYAYISLYLSIIVCIYEALLLTYVQSSQIHGLVRGNFTACDKTNVSKCYLRSRELGVQQARANPNHTVHSGLSTTTWREQESDSIHCCVGVCT